MPKRMKIRMGMISISDIGVGTWNEGGSCGVLLRRARLHEEEE